MILKWMNKNQTSYKISLWLMARQKKIKKKKEKMRVNNLSKMLNANSLLLSNRTHQFREAKT